VRGRGRGARLRGQGIYGTGSNQGERNVAKSIRLTLLFVIACSTAMLAVAGASAQKATSEAGRGASAKLIACMTACEETQMTCLQGIAQVPRGQRTIKDINAFNACNRTEEVCDHRCRKKSK